MGADDLPQDPGADVKDRLLQVNPDPVKVVPAAQRDVWTRQPRSRCHHEDRRGQCSSRETTARWNATERHAEVYCERHSGDFTIEDA